MVSCEHFMAPLAPGPQLVPFIGMLCSPCKDCPGHPGPRLLVAPVVDQDTVNNHPYLFLWLLVTFCHTTPPGYVPGRSH